MWPRGGEPVEPARRPAACRCSDAGERAERASPAAWPAAMDADLPTPGCTGMQLLEEPQYSFHS